jgi:hypothetical protein
MYGYNEWLEDNKDYLPVIPEETNAYFQEKYIDSIEGCLVITPEDRAQLQKLVF